MHADIQIIFYMYIDHIKNADNWVAAILDMQISKCNVISGYALFMKYRNHNILQCAEKSNNIHRNVLRSRHIWCLHFL
jgi:hypothetical protein